MTFEETAEQSENMSGLELNFSTDRSGKHHPHSIIQP